MITSDIHLMIKSFLSDSRVSIFLMTVTFISLLLANTATAGEVLEPEVYDHNSEVISTLDAGSGYNIVHHVDTEASSQPWGTDRPNAGVSLFSDTLSDVAITFDGAIDESVLTYTSSAATVDNPTIDTMEVGGSQSLSAVNDDVLIMGSATYYHLSDGSSWRSGAGVGSRNYMHLVGVETAGDKVRYTFNPPDNGIIYKQIDYNAGDHSSQGTLGATGQHVLEATIGDTEAVMTGTAEILANDETDYGEPRFNFFSTIVGSIVPFELTYHNSAGWTADTFNTDFYFSLSGLVDFANPVSTPQIIDIAVTGPPKVAEGDTAQFHAYAIYDNDQQRRITNQVMWQVVPDTFATINEGSLITSSPPGNDGHVTVTASLSVNGTLLSASKEVEILPESALLSDDWPTYQANIRHNGYVPASLSTSYYRLRWSKRVNPYARPVLPVAAADNKVFVSVQSRFTNDISFYALDDEDGSELWSKEFGNVNAVNPPAYAYGIVYIQAGQKISSDDDSPLLYAFDADNGEQVFKSKFNAQWETYLAPTVDDGNVYVNGGYYGGMYSFDAYSGEQNWFTGLPQYHGWTPTLDDTYAYAYVGYGLYIVKRDSGELEIEIPDPDYDWRGYTMNQAPAIDDLGNIVVINGGRLMSYDIEAQRMAWQRSPGFTGQASIANGVIYAINNDSVQALDQLTGNTLWEWQPGTADQLEGTIIVTNTHFFVSGQSSVYAVDLVSHNTAWSQSVAGHLAFADGSLYIASEDGDLTVYEFGPPPDSDADGVIDIEDNCKLIANPDQSDSDSDGIGDACNDDMDQDSDEWNDLVDNCPLVANGGQHNKDMDEYGDACDPFPEDADNVGACMAVLDDRDGEIAELYFLIDSLNAQLHDEDLDGIIDVYDICPSSSFGDMVDVGGCTIEQFCATPDQKHCANMDWRNDEPLNSLDCKWSPKHGCIPR